MRSTAIAMLGLALVWQAARADVEPWGLPACPGQAAASSPVPIRLGRPEPLTRDQQEMMGQENRVAPLNRSGLVVRGQSPDPPPPVPPPPPPPPSDAAGPQFPGGDEPFNSGIVTKTRTSKFGEVVGTWWDNTKHFVTEVPGSVVAVFQPGPGGHLFQSDHKFDAFSSPVTNPFFFEDPRALTEVRPIFMWQQTPSNNPTFKGGDNLFAGAQVRVAFTDWASLVVNRLGVVSMEPHGNTPGFASHSGFSELWLGPKFTIIRNDTSNTLLAAGLTFEIPTGPAKVFQNTGSLGLAPYASFGQKFFPGFAYGSFNFLNTTGYSFRTDTKRSEFLFSSFHVDFDVGNWHRVYPFTELNWFFYPRNGGVQAIGFEGADLFNFGSHNAGRSDLNVALGSRVKITDAIQAGVGFQFGLLNGVHSLENTRLTVDMIIRY